MWDNKIDMLVKMVDLFIKRDENVNVTEENIQEYIVRAKETLDINDETICEMAKKELQYKYQIKSEPGISLVDDYDDISWYSDTKEDIDPKFWRRYETLLTDEKDYSPNIVTLLSDDTLDRKLMNYIGDPNSKEGFLKRGLAIGDVQSGKTSTYIGLICKAADAGYKILILLTGTVESLRRQTQERVEEGFIGIDMSSATLGKRVGVGIDNKDILATSMTTRTSDFTKNIAGVATSLNENIKVFVIKKNYSILSKLKKWFISLSNENRKNIEAPLLLIDDEADNASINTGKKENDPTKINKTIREILELFNRSTYVGFTATPFANVFIDPETEDEMFGCDLFPEDFIVSLPTPSDYIGPSEIFLKDGKYHNQIRYIKDAGITEDDGHSFYFKHDKSWDDVVPQSLTESIYTFYLANAIRDIKGEKKTHRSMLINMSRLIDVQKTLAKKIEEIHKSAYAAIKFNLSNNTKVQDIKDPILKKIYSVWEKEYSKDVSWKEVTNILFEAIKNITIIVVNSKNKNKLEYVKGSEQRVIAIGGLALSRGLTLEGLITSYFYRNTATYDVLMQMGRWFGYRKDYESLFRVWIHEDSARWYGEIAEATEQLKLDMRIMHEEKMKPKDFGIRVRNDSEELNITASNKMRNSTDEYEFESYFGTLIETPYLWSDHKQNINNFKNVVSFVEEQVKRGMVFAKMNYSGEHHIIKDVDKDSIVNLLEKLDTSKYNANFNINQILRFMNNNIDDSLDEWNVAFMDGSKDEEQIVEIAGRKIYRIFRGGCSIEGDMLKVGKRGRLGAPTDGMVGIDDYNGFDKEHIINEAKEQYEKQYFESKRVPFSGKTYPANTWFKYIKNRKPLLIIYFINVKSEKDSSNSKSIDKLNENLNGAPVVGLGIGFPNNENHKYRTRSKYKANKSYNWFQKDAMLNELEEE